MARKPLTAQPVALNLALQGGGSHGAFTWGVLDRLLDEDTLMFSGASGASAGALNAAVLATGLAEGGRAGAQAALRAFWMDVAAQGACFGHWPRLPGAGLAGTTSRATPSLRPSTTREISSCALSAPTSSTRWAATRCAPCCSATSSCTPCVKAN